MKKIGIAMGGGGARGLAHIGVLKVLQENKIPIHFISGTSMGAIIGACYACEPDATKLEENIIRALEGSAFSHMRISIFGDKKGRGVRGIFTKAQSFVKYSVLHVIEHNRQSILSGDKLRSIIGDIIPDIDMRETRIPFTCVATDLTNGTETVFEKGPIRDAVLASSSIPGVFPPVEINGIYYCDGGAVNTTPVSVVKKMGADFIIASDVKGKLVKWEKPQVARAILERYRYITAIVLNDMRLKQADVSILPSVKFLHWSAFNKYRHLIKEGENAAAGKIAEIKAKIGMPGLLKGFNKVIDIITQKAKKLYRGRPA
ncbi:MAG: patatin-like phospholipase family protein [Endomicrobiales bacterium]|nr:patatin-like phospholipase family protein [Endomicrobiales bacterium]